MSNFICPAPHEIRLNDGSPAYKCRSCRATENLYWYKGTSCPVCTNADCTQALDNEWAKAYAMLSDPDEDQP
jgi:hypothetical protein